MAQTGKYETIGNQIYRSDRSGYMDAYTYANVIIQYYNEGWADAKNNNFNKKYYF